MILYKSVFIHTKLSETIIMLESRARCELELERQTLRALSSSPKKFSHNCVEFCAWTRAPPPMPQSTKASVQSSLKYAPALQDNRMATYPSTVCNCWGVFPSWLRASTCGLHNLLACFCGEGFPQYFVMPEVNESNRCIN